jgi:hypothetical protein
MDHAEPDCETGRGLKEAQIESFGRALKSCWYSIVKYDKHHGNPHHINETHILSSTF